MRATTRGLAIASALCRLPAPRLGLTAMAASVASARASPTATSGAPRLIKHMAGHVGSLTTLCRPRARSCIKQLAHHSAHMPLFSLTTDTDQARWPARWGSEYSCHARYCVTLSVSLPAQHIPHDVARAMGQAAGFMYAEDGGQQLACRVRAVP